MVRNGIRMILSSPDTCNPDVRPATVILVSRTGFATISASTAVELRATYPDVPVLEEMINNPHTRRLPTNAYTWRLNESFPVRAALRAIRGRFYPLIFAVMPNCDVL